MTLTEEQLAALARAIDYINETDLPVGELDGFDREVLRAMIDSSDPITDVTELVELLAAGEHEQWAAWAQAILDSEPGLSDGRKAAWPGLIATPYENLSEEMKDKDRREVHLRSQAALDYIQQQSAEIERLRAGHCADCCCARSWEALGISEYTGKSIPEEITHLREWMIKNRDAATELQYQLDDEVKENERLRKIIDSPPEEESWKADYDLLHQLDASGAVCVARKWHAAYRKAQNSNLLRKQENERLRAREAGLEERLERTLRDSFKKQEEQAARIKELESSLGEAEALTKKNAETMNGYLARITELEDALVEGLTNFLHYRASCYDPARRCPYAKECDDCSTWDACGHVEIFRSEARRRLQAEGKIGSGGGA